MGASESSESTPDELTVQFDEKELQLLRKAYARLANSSGALEAESLNGLAPGVPWVAMHAAMSAVAAGAPVRWRHFLEVIVGICKGRASDRREFVAALYADPQSSSLLTKASLERLLRDAFFASRGGEASEAPVGLEAAADDVLLGALSGSVSAAEWAAWVGGQLPALPLALETYVMAYLCALGRLDGGASSGGTPPLASGGLLELPAGSLSAVQEPLLRPASGQEEGHELLTPTSAWLLKLSMGASSEAAEWRCLYASRVMGLSLNRFVHHCAGYAGPTLLVALTETGEVFGAYLDAPFKPTDKYQGGSGCFLFTLAPHLHIYRPTNISKNYVLYNPPQTGALATESYMLRHSAAGNVPEVLGFGGQTARLRLALESDLNVLRWHHSCTAYTAHSEAGSSVPEGTRKVRALELWGCGGADADAVQRALRERRVRDAGRAGKVDRAAMFGMASDNDWRSEDNVDRMILESAGAHTFYSAQLEKLPDEKKPS